MPLYDIIATLANLIRPYAGDPVVTIDPRDAAKIHRQWPVRAPEDANFIDVFGQLAGNAVVDGTAVKLGFDPNPSDPNYPVIPYEMEDRKDAWELKIPDPQNLVQPATKARTYMIHKGFRVPYSFNVAVLDAKKQPTSEMKEVHANIFVLFTGWAEP